jgi:hypothetical protein
MAASMFESRAGIFFGATIAVNTADLHTYERHETANVSLIQGDTFGSVPAGSLRRAARLDCKIACHR